MVFAGFAQAERWPMGPGDEVQEIGNYCHQFASYGSPYYHDGLDIMNDAGDPVYSVSDGFVREVTYMDPMYSGLFITANAAGQDSGWCYWHITSTTMPFIAGDAVSVDDYLGDIATWSTAGFHHLHFTRCRFPGNDGEWYDAIDNPIEFLVPPAEPDAPEFQEAQTGQMFSFVENNTDTQIDPASVYGQVDIIARISDRILDPDWVVIPYQIDWWVENSSDVVVVPTRLFVTHTGDCFDDSTIDVVYKDSGIWDSDSDYDSGDRKYYFIITNTDGDGQAEETDSLFAFYSNSLDNGVYTLYVRASDWAGSTTTESMEFTINNSTGENVIDIVQVLDRSGSMGGYASDSSTDTKIDVLKYAADEFIAMMKPDAGNRLGIVQFNQDVVPFSAPIPDLQELTTANFDDFRDSVASMSHGGSTSIGDGLDEADSQLDGIGDPNPLQAVLLISDGKENTSQMIADIQPDLISHSIKVYALGLGYSSGIDEEKLTDLADDTFGDYRITSDDLEFRKFFLDVLADAANWEIITDPIREFGTGIEYIDVPVTEYDRKVIFTAMWEGDHPDYALSLSLISPNGKEITPKTRNAKIKYVSHKRYAFYELQFPLDAPLSGQYEGTWKMKLVKNADTGDIRYAFTAYSDSSVEFDATFSSVSIATGEKIMVAGRLTKGGVPIPGLEIDVECDVPLAWPGNLLYTARIDTGSLDPDLKDNADPVTLADQKLRILSKGSKKEILPRGESGLKIYDDGQHEDGDAGDGIYCNSFTSTRMPGSYTFRFVASGVPVGGGKTTSREWTKSFFNRVNIDPEYSIFKVETFESADGMEVKRVKVVPRDKFRNYMGPGHDVNVLVSFAGKERSQLLKDNIDGTYTGDIVLTREESQAGADILFEVDDKPFTPKEIAGASRWMASFHFGYNKPVGDFGNDFDPGLSIYADLGYKFNRTTALVFNLGYNAFKTKNPVFEDMYWINLSGNLKYTFQLGGPYSLSLAAGPGVYFPENGDPRMGFNAGFAVGYEFSSVVTFELGIDQHVIFKGIEVYNPSRTGSANFWVAHAGLIFNL